MPAMSARQAHRLRILRDTDALHGLAVACALLIASGGLLYVYYALRVWNTARRAPAWPELDPQQPARLLLFGKRCEDGEPDADFAGRIQRALALAGRHPQLELLLLGGGPQPSEAAIAQRALQAGGLSIDARITLEDTSRDTLENLRHARGLLAADAGEVLLVSSRYHLARCSLFAGWLGIPHRVCAAEERWAPSWRERGRLLLEAGYMSWIDSSRRWARLIGHRRMLAKVS
jgi:uncharacterized SAM-binding protein YcdF (DUF218 family)